MLSEEIRGIANYIIVGLLIDNKIIRLLYTIANKVEKLEDDLDRAEGERMQFGDRVVQLEAELDGYKAGAEIENTLIGLLEDKVTQLSAKSEALDILIEDASGISLQGKIYMIAIGLGAWERARELIQKDK